MILIFVLLFGLGPANAQEITTKDRLVGDHFNRPETGPTASPKERISGQCVVVAGPTNPMAHPCSALTLILDTKDGHSSLLYSRTDSEGHFEFNAPAGKKYFIRVDSKFFNVVSPKELVMRGEEIDLRLEQH